MDLDPQAVFSSGDEQQEAGGIILSPLTVQMRCVQGAAEIAQIATLAGRVGIFPLA